MQLGKFCAELNSFCGMTMPNANPFRPIRVDESAEISRVGVKVLRLLDEHVLALVPDLIGANPVVLHPRVSLRFRVKMIALHPTRRAPRRSPQPQRRLVALRGVNEWDQGLPVVLDAEMLQLKIAIGLVVAVSLSGKIVRANRHAAICEARASLRIKEFLQHALPVLLAQRHQRGPPELVEATSETLQRPALPVTFAPGRHSN